MSKEILVPDHVWALIAPHFPPRPPHRTGNRPWSLDRHALGGITFVVKTGRAYLLAAAGRQAAGVWQALYRAILD